MRLARQTRPRRGAAVVELAILLPFLVFLFIIAVDFARVFYFSQVLVNCARNGAAHGSDPGAEAKSPYASVEAAALADAGALNPKPTVTSKNGTDAAGDPYIEVTVAWDFRTVTNYPGVPNPLRLSRTVRMRVAPTSPK